MGRKRKSSGSMIRGGGFRLFHGSNRMMNRVPTPGQWTRFQKFSLPRTRVPHISLVFREMWDTANLDLSPAS
jgi:hypothetical protein